MTRAPSIGTMLLFRNTKGPYSATRWSKEWIECAKRRSAERQPSRLLDCSLTGRLHSSREVREFCAPGRSGATSSDHAVPCLSLTDNQLGDRYRVSQGDPNRLLLFNCTGRHFYHPFEPWRRRSGARNTSCRCQPRFFAGGLEHALAEGAIAEVGVVRSSSVRIDDGDGFEGQPGLGGYW